jgi:hypothetical protein
LKKIEQYLQCAARCREMALTVSLSNRQWLQEMAETWDVLAELEKRHPAAETNNVIEFVLPPNDPKGK